MAVLVRTLGIAVFSGLAWWCLHRGIQGSLLFLLTGFAALLVAAVLAARPLAGVFGTLWAGLFVPGDRFDRPQPMYSIPEGKLAAQDYPAALQAYADLAAEHPREIVPYLRMMEIYLGHYGDEQSAREIREQGLRLIRGRANREKFRRAADTLLPASGG